MIKVKKKIGVSEDHHQYLSYMKAERKAKSYDAIIGYLIKIEDQMLKEKSKK